jgi:hypothetical protein
MSGEIVLGRGEYEIAIATGRPPSQVTLTARGAGASAGGEPVPGPVTLEAPRLLADGFAFRARVASPCRILYQLSLPEK